MKVFESIAKKDTSRSVYYTEQKAAFASPDKGYEARSGYPLQPTVQLKPNNTGLPGVLKENIESLSGYSMDDVKVNYNSSKPAGLNALAYAQGNHIHLAPGQEKHLPHEAWHVVQQKQGRVKPTMQMKRSVEINDDKAFEREADLIGRITSTTGQPFIDHKFTGAVQQMKGFPQLDFNKNTQIIFKDDGLSINRSEANGYKASPIQLMIINGYDTSNPINFQAAINAINNDDELKSIYKSLKNKKKKDKNETNAMLVIDERRRTTFPSWIKSIKKVDELSENYLKNLNVNKKKQYQIEAVAIFQEELGKQNVSYPLTDTEVKKKRKERDQEINDELESKRKKEGFPEVEAKTTKHSTQFGEYLLEQQKAMEHLAGSVDSQLAFKKLIGMEDFQNKVKMANALASKLDNPNEINFTIQDNRISEHLFFAEFIDELWRLYRFNVQTEPNIHQPGIPTWGELTQLGSGTNVLTSFSTFRTFPRGSSAGGTQQELPWLGNLLHNRKVKDGSKTLYVKGHLLNDHLGGPSAAYNLVPLIGKSHYLGSQDTNGIHVAIVETQLKDIVEQILSLRNSDQQLPPSTVESATYQANAVYGNHNRANTSFMKEAINTFISAFGAQDIDQLNTQQYLEKMKKEQSSKWKQVADAVWAVAPSIKQQQEYPKNTFKLMKKNAELWKFEDEHVPLKVEVLLTVERLDGTTETVVNTNILNLLSNEKTQLYHES